MQAKLWKSLAVAVATTAIVSGTAAAQEAYPSQPIRIVSSQAVGGGVDALIRAIGNALAEKNGKGFIVEAKPGGNGLVALNTCANAKPDGYTICLVNTQYVLLPFLQTKPAYDPLKDFEPVTHLVTASLALGVSKSVGAKTLQELIAYAKANPGKLNYISLGAANPVDLGVEAVMRQHGLNWVPIPYKGAGDGMTAFAAGDVQLMFFTSLNVIASVNTGTGSIVFVTGDKKLPGFPNVPTLAETGLDNPAVGGIWFSLVAPPGTPKAIREKLAADINAVLKTPAIIKRAQDTGYELVGNTPDQFGAFLATEHKRSGAALQGKAKID